MAWASTCAARPARRQQETTQPVYAETQIILWPGPAHNIT